MKIGYIVNPAAGKKQVEKWVERIRCATEAKGLPYIILMTEGPGDGVNKGKLAVASNCNVAVAVGGDGTVSEVVNGIKDSDTALGVIPVGTGNDFVKSLDIPLDFEDALACVFNGRCKTIDMGVINGRHFINVASVGFDAQVVLETRNIKKYFAGPVAYVLGVFKALKEYNPFVLEIETEGRLIKRRAVLMAVGNGAFYGGGMKITPLACMDDGLLDVCVVEHMPRSKILRLFSTIFTGKHLLRQEIEYFTTKSIAVKCDNAYINADGDIYGMCPASFEVKAGAARVMVP